MPKASSGSVKVRSVPRPAVEDALRAWAEEAVRADPRVLRVGYFGSYARGDYNPASDLDVVIVVGASDIPRHQRGGAFDLAVVPVGCEVFVYTTEEVARPGPPFGFLATVLREAVWVYPRA